MGRVAGPRSIGAFRLIEDCTGKPNMGIVFRKTGKYLRCSERTTHTGSHRDTEWVDDLQQATVFYGAPPLRLRQDEQLQNAERLEAVETRTVTLTLNGEAATYTGANG